jgi:hypothetical protein
MIANFFKFLIGFILALGILGGGSVATALYFMNRAVPPPPKPEFANDPGRRVKRPKATVAKKKRVTPAAKTVPTPTSAETPAAKPLPPGAYRARVSWGQGLSMRAEPTPGAQRVGGVGFNQEVFVLEESPDKTWQKVRVADGEQEGWVKSGNTRRAEEGGNQQ